MSKEVREKNNEEKKPDETSEVKQSIDSFGTINNAFDFEGIQYLTIIGSIETFSSSTTE